MKNPVDNRIATKPLVKEKYKKKKLKGKSLAVTFSIMYCKTGLVAFPFWKIVTNNNKTMVSAITSI